jgi:uncharacterized coiled-coil protein SlyX
VDATDPVQVDPERVIRSLGQQIADQAVEIAKLNAVVAALLEQQNDAAKAAENSAIAKMKGAA